MLPIQILQQNLTIPLLPLIPTHIIAPASDRARQAAGHVRFLADLGDRVEVRADGEDDAAAARQPTERLPLGPEVVVLDGLVLLRREPAHATWLAVFWADAGRPGEFVVDLDEVVVLRESVYMSCLFYLLYIRVSKKFGDISLKEGVKLTR
jgi:hypothetical protein